MFPFIGELFPATDFSKINLDWIFSVLESYKKALEDATDEISGSVTAAASSATAAASSATAAAGNANAAQAAAIAARDEAIAAEQSADRASAIADFNVSYDTITIDFDSSRYTPSVGYYSAWIGSAALQWPVGRKMLGVVSNLLLRVEAAANVQTSDLVFANTIINIDQTGKPTEIRYFLRPVNYDSTKVYRLIITYAYVTT